MKKILVLVALAVCAEARAAKPPESALVHVTRAIEASRAARGEDSDTLSSLLLHFANDPHTFLLSSSAKAALFSDLAGLPHREPGVTLVKQENGRLAVRDVFAGCGADALGVTPGDLLLASGDEVLTHLPDLFHSFGAARLELMIERNGETLFPKGDVSPCVIPVAESRVLDGVGILKLRVMTRVDPPRKGGKPPGDKPVDSLEATRAALRAFDEADAHAIILDLRGNAGGAHVREIASLFTDAPVLMLERKPRVAKDVEMARLGARASARKLAVLVDESSCSAAEMIPFALQELGAARIFGRATCGALTFPETEELSDGSLLSHVAGVAVGVKSKKVPEGFRVEPDEELPVLTPGDLRAGRDPQLDAVMIWAKKP